MKVFQVEGSWSRDSVQLSERAVPAVGRGQVRIKMAAAALNYRDWIMPLGAYGKRMQQLPLILLSDGVGVVDECGPDVERVHAGDRVCPIFYQSWISGEPNNDRFRSSLGCEQDGTMAEYLVVPAECVVSVPAHLSDVEAATLPTAAVTAWRALVTEGRMKAGETVLIQGTGGVSLFALQFAKLLGLKTIITSSSDEKLARARTLGADITINYRQDPTWGLTARNLTNGVGVDLVMEVGGAATVEQSLRSVRTGGTLSMIGVLSGAQMQIPLGQVVTRHIKMQGITVGSRDDFESMAAAITLHKLHPVVDRIFPFEELRGALEYLSLGQHFGKICILH